MAKVNVDRFYGIEISEFPARIAEVAMWMTDHIMNARLSAAFGESFVRIPLKTSPNIFNADALETDWADILAPEKCSYILGNPPFGGAKYQTPANREQVRRIASLDGSGGTLDYVCAWFIRAGEYVRGAGRHPPRPEEPRSGVSKDKTANDTVSKDAARPSPFETGSLSPPQGEGRGSKLPRIGFVATNSITQGEQVAQLWPLLFERYGLEIAFAHRTFAWMSDARGKAHVHCVIIGLTRRDDEPKEKRLFTYDDIKSDPHESRHAALSPYLFDASGLADRHLFVEEINRPLLDVARPIIGSKPIDGGYYIFTEDERAEFLVAEPRADALLNPYLGSDEFINGDVRYILALQDASPASLRTCPMLLIA